MLKFSLNCFDHIIVHCKWGNWTEGECSKTCGKDGFRVDTRKREVEAKNGGKDCEGDKVKSVKCDLVKCPCKT